MPYSYLLIALEKTRIINFNALILPIVFLALIFLLKNDYSLLSVAIAKTVAFMICALYLYFSIKISGFNFFDFIIKRMLSICFSLLSLFLIYYFLLPILEKVEPLSAFSTIKTTGIGLIMFSVSFLVYLVFNKKLSVFIKNILRDVFLKKQNIIT